jgi:hypothetical protein
VMCVADGERGSGGEARANRCSTCVVVQQRRLGIVERRHLVQASRPRPAPLLPPRTRTTVAYRLPPRMIFALPCH